MDFIVENYQMLLLVAGLFVANLIYNLFRFGKIRLNDEEWREYQKDNWHI